MADTNEILIQVDVDTQKMQQELSAAIKSVAELKRVQKALKEEIEAGNDASGEYAAQLADCSRELEKAQREVKNHTAMLQLNNTQAIKTTDSLDSQRQTLNTLQKAYGTLSGEAKAAADAEGGLRSQIKQLTDSIREQEHAIGDDRRSVGNYLESIQKAIPDLGKMKGAAEAAAGGSNLLSKSIDNTDKIMKGMMANPFFGTIFLLGGVLNLIGAALKKNEKAMEGVQTLTAGIGVSLKQLKPILDWLMDFLVNALLKALDWVMEAVKKAFTWIDKLASKFGKNLGLADAFTAGAASAHNMSEEVEDLGGKVETLAERMKRLHDEAFKAWLIEEQWREDQAKTMELLTARSKEAEKAAEAALKAQEKALELINRGLDEEEDTEEEPDFNEMARKWFGLDAEGVEYFKQLLGDGMDYATAKSEALKDMQRRTIAEVGAAMGDLSSAFSSLGDALDDFGENNEAAKKASKAFTMVSILASEAQSIAEGALAISAGVAQAQSVPFPANIAAIVSTTTAIGSVLATTTNSIKQSKDVFKGAQKYSTGTASVPGRYEDGDIHPVYVAGEEMILNPKQQARLFAIANGAQTSAYESTFNAMRAAISSMPAPVMVYEEFQSYQSQTARYNEIAKI